jgi:DNA polymerase III epsilon subunit-like protein
MPDNFNTELSARSSQTGDRMSATLYLDTETTGLAPRFVDGVNYGAELVEVAVIDDTGAVLFDELVNPGRSIPQNVIAIHGITDDMVADAMPAAEARRAVLDIVRGRQLVIYNAEFDSRFFPGIWEAAEIRCCMRLFAAYAGQWNDYFGNWRWHKLMAAARQAGHDWGEAGAHRALADTLACRSVWRWLATEDNERLAAERHDQRQPHQMQRARSG